MHELAGLPSRVRPLVLTPPGPAALHNCRAAARNRPIVTVGDAAHVAALDGWRGDVLVKLASSMRRFGVAHPRARRLRASGRAAGLTVIGHSIHLPLAGEDADRVAEVERWLAVLDPRRQPSDTRPRCG